MAETGDDSTDSVACALVWKLARTHGWSGKVSVSDLAADAAVTNEKEAREIARNTLPGYDFISYHQGTDNIWLDPPPTDDLADFLSENCGYSRISVEATLDSYL